MTKDDNVCRGCMGDRNNENICPVCGWDHEAGPLSKMHLAPGTILQGKYLVGRALGQGGFGVTYLARDLMLDIKLAIKEYLPQDLASRSHGEHEVMVHTESLGHHYHDGLERFLQEAKTLARFEGHPNIVSVRDFFKANGTAYFVMSYIEGITLKDYVKEQGGSIAVDQAVMIMMPVLEALKEVHGAGILHRDISPDNIFMTSKGQVIVIDFGAARQELKDKGRSMSIIMKPGFTPEEQYRSKGLQGPWTDIYALGATMYRAITGQMPPESLDRLSEDELIPPSAMGISIAPAMEAALLKAMAVAGKDRFQTAEAFQETLAAGLMAEPQVRDQAQIQHQPQHQTVAVPTPMNAMPPSMNTVPPPMMAAEASRAHETPTPSMHQQMGSKDVGSKKWIGLGIGALVLLVVLVAAMNLGGNGNGGGELPETPGVAQGETPAELSAETQEAEGSEPVEGNRETNQEEVSQVAPTQEQLVPQDLYQALNQTGRLDILGISEASLFQQYGQSANSFYWEGGYFYDYNDFYAMVDEYSPDREVMFLGFRQLPGIYAQAGFDQVKQVYGTPLWDEIGASNQSHLLNYEVQGYSVMFEGFSGPVVDLITVTTIYDGYDGESEGDYEYDEALQALYERGYALWQTWIYINPGTTVWSSPFEGEYMGEITSDGDIYVTDYEADSSYNLWLQLQLVDENGNEVLGWVIY